MLCRYAVLLLVVVVFVRLGLLATRAIGMLESIVRQVRSFFFRMAGVAKAATLLPSLESLFCRFDAWALRLVQPFADIHLSFPPRFHRTVWRWNQRWHNGFWCCFHRFSRRFANSRRSWPTFMFRSSVYNLGSSLAALVSPPEILTSRKQMLAQGGCHGDLNNATEHNAWRFLLACFALLAASLLVWHFDLSIAHPFLGGCVCVCVCVCLCLSRTPVCVVCLFVFRLLLVLPGLSNFGK